ncbi:biotin carboxylase [Curvibacter sp. APW13]|uniref:biotin carboxylase n=1 Tax=Curvibacter sp. APW13 TaxID=3077236 RepID=UPI0028DF16B7|nr:biotin carboxylase [Curvibacter sp. APW13]MDT8991950.1 biotin carboxylase [Curvibacter sp. APW13]
MRTSHLHHDFRSFLAPIESEHAHLQHALRMAGTPLGRRASQGSQGKTVVLRSIEDIKRHFAHNERPYFFISATHFNTLEMHRWVNHWHNITLIDCMDGSEPAIFNHADDHSRSFSGIEDVNHYLLDSAEVQRHIRRLAPPRSGAQALFLFFDEALEAKAQQLGLSVALPRNALVRQVDSKVVTTRIGNAAGVASVPNVLAHVDSYAALRAAADGANLGPHLVVQLPYGDSGKTTFFISDEQDYLRVAAAIEAERTVKIMRRVRCVGTAIEACATRWGTFVGPLLKELIGQSALTPYAGGWCGNENHQGAFDMTTRRAVQRKTQAIGQALYERGYRGTFEIDYLIDLDSAEVYLGELNPRLTGVTTLTNTSEFTHQQLPLLLFHLLEYDPQVDLRMDVDAFNEAVLRDGAQGISSQLILKHTRESLETIKAAPPSGVYRLDDHGALQLRKTSSLRSDACAPDEAFVLRILRPHDLAYRGADLAILFANEPLSDEQGVLSPRGVTWTTALNQAFDRTPLSAGAAEDVPDAFANIKGSASSSTTP